MKHSSVSLFTFLKEVDDKTLNDLCTRILNIFEENNKNERMITSILAFLDRLLSSGCIQSIIDDPNSEIPDRMLTLVKKEMKCQHKTQLLISSIQVFCQLLQVIIISYKNTPKIILKLKTSFFFFFGFVFF